VKILLTRCWQTAKTRHNRRLTSAETLRLRRKALRPTSKLFDSVRRWLVWAPAGRTSCPSCRRSIHEHLVNCRNASDT